MSMQFKLIGGLFLLLVLAGDNNGQPDKENPKGGAFTGKAIAVHVKSQAIVPLDQPTIKTFGERTFVIGQVPNRATKLWLPLVDVLKIEEFADLDELSKHYQIGAAPKKKP